MAVSAGKTAALFVGSAGIFCLWETYRGNSKFYSNILIPSLHFVIPAEKAHNLAVKYMQYTRHTKFKDPECLKTKVWNQEFSNPIGIAAGFDKHAEAMQGLTNVGFGFIEIGSVTPLPQSGNTKPRVFRLSEDKSIINRYGFNSCGHDVVADRLEKWRQSDKNTILGVNLGKNKDSENHIQDYVLGVTKLGQFADYIVINVSSPNTPGLRKLQGENFLKELLCSVNIERNKLLGNIKPRLLVKIAPDLMEKDVKDISKIVLLKECGIDGIIISNTTVTRPVSLRSKNMHEIGGLSGPPLKQPSNELIKQMYSLTNGELPIIGVGGISSGKDAYEKILAGASLVQFYTALIFHGPPVLSKIKSELAELVQNDGFDNINNAVGAAHRKGNEN